MLWVLFYVVGGLLCWALASCSYALYLVGARGAEIDAALRRASGLPWLLPRVKHAATIAGRTAVRWVQERWAARQRRKEEERAEARRRREEERAEAERRAEEARTILGRSVRCGSALPEGYELRQSDWERSNDVDPWIKKHYRGVVYGQFGNACLQCGAEGPLDLDHAWWPKARGGNFVMRHTTGLVANVVVLCQPCNASKSDGLAVDYFTREGLAEITTALSALTERLGSDPELRRRLG